MIEPAESELAAENELLRRERAAAAAPPAEPAADDTPLARNRDFQVVLVGQGLSSLGDAVTFTALPILVLALTGSGVAMGVVGALGTLPDLLLGLPAGAFADRLDRRKMMFSADLGRAILTALIPISVAVGGPTMGVIVLVTFPINALRVLWLAAYTAAVPGLVGRSQIGRANAIFEAVFNIGFILGPSIAGLLALTIGPGATIALDAISFFISAGALLLVRRPLKPPPRTVETHLVAEMRDGVTYVVTHPVLRTVILFWGLMQIGLGGLTQALTFHIEIDRGLTTAVLGIVISAFGFGSLIGAVIATKLVGGVLGRNMLVGSFITGIAIVMIVLEPPIPVVVAASFIAGIAQANVLVAYITLRTTHSPDALLGRVGSTARLFSVGLTPIGLLAAGIVIDAANGATAIAAMAVWTLGLTVLFGISATVRHARAPTVRPVT
jgi:MFS family permease